MLVRSGDTVLGTQRLTNQFGCAAQWALARVQADAAVAVDVVAVGEEPALLASGRDACRSDRERRANYRRRVRLHCTRHPRRWSARQPAAPAFEEPVSPSKVQATRGGIDIGRSGSRRDMRMAIDTFIVYVGVYPSVGAAEADKTW